ncbi:MAG: CPBP family intramembrane metalloprotease [Chloroflexota bacterium]|nr:CPBP family intramembrane metalloprotease [Chloroflexota bacterium]
MSTALVSHTTPYGGSSSLRAWITCRPLSSFVVLAFVLTWPWLIADALGSRGLIPFRLTLSGPGIVLVLLMSYGPTFAALIATWATEGSPGLRALLRRLLPWRASLGWYIIALAGPAALAFAAGQFQELLGATWRPLPAPLLQVTLMGVLASVIHGVANGEEIGWRGFALPRLQERHSALNASLILGAIWAAFHIPIMFTLGGVGGSQTFATLLPFLAGTLAMSVVVTSIFNATSGSLIAVILLHGAMNSWPEVFAPAESSSGITWTGSALMVLLAVVAVLVFGPTYLARMPGAALPMEREGKVQI